MNASIIVAIISGVCSFIGAYYSNQKQLAVLGERMDNLIDRVDRLSERVNAHNNVVARTYALEARVDSLEREK